MLIKTRLIPSILILGFAFVFDATALMPQRPHCADVVEVELGAWREIAGNGPFESRLFSIFVAEPGELLLDAAALTPGSEPRIGAFASSCESGAEGSLYLARHLSGGVVSIDQPGYYFFRITAQDPSVRSADYVLRNRFATRAFVPPKDIEEPEEDPVLTPRKDIEEPEEDPVLAPGKDIEEPEEDPVLLTERDSNEPADFTWLLDSGSAVAAELCPSSNRDHDDVFACAAPIAPRQDVEGEIRHRPNQDIDVFTFMLTDFRTVEIRAAAENAITAALHDAKGHRLALLPAARDLRLTQTLGPGRYFIRLSGAQAAEGLYRLHLDTSTL